MKSHSYRIISVDRQNGMAVIRFDDNPSMEWNFELPVGDDGKPLTGPDFRAWLAQATHRVLKNADRRTDCTPDDWRAFENSEKSPRQTSLDDEFAEIEFMIAAMPAGD